MNKRKILSVLYYLCVSQICFSSASKASNYRGEWVLRTIAIPFGVALDIIGPPLSKFSTKGPTCDSEKHYEESLGFLKDKEFMQASQLLEQSAVEGNPYAMYHLGRLMLLLPDQKFEPLRCNIPFNSAMGLAYLKNASEMNFAPAGELLSHYDQLVELNRTLAIAYGLEGKEPNIPLAQKAMKRLVNQKNPLACYFIAEANLMCKEITHPWLTEVHLSFFERRKKELPLLIQAANKNAPNARRLMAELEREDALYGMICGLILKNASCVFGGKSLGDAGFQEAYIDHLVSLGFKIQGYELTPEVTMFLKETMAMRVRQVYYFFNSYFTYVQSWNKILIKEGKTLVDQMGCLEALKLDIVGRNVCVLDRLGLPPYTEDKIFDFRMFGLVYPVTEHDAERAYDKLINSADDFGDEILTDVECDAGNLLIGIGGAE